LVPIFAEPGVGKFPPNVATGRCGLRGIQSHRRLITRVTVSSDPVHLLRGSIGLRWR
jgi:hypothetical protein